jgi:hypothetical protein
MNLVRILVSISIVTFYFLDEIILSQTEKLCFVVLLSAVSYLSERKMVTCISNFDCIRNLTTLVKDVHIRENVLNDKQYFMIKYILKVKQY